MWPAWEWITRPSTRWLFAANEGDLATRDSVACRRLVESEWYRERWGDVFQLTTDQNVKTWFENDKRGMRIATTVGSNVTGKKGDRLVCFPAGTMIATNKGDFPIEKITQKADDDLLVASFNHRTNKTEFRPIIRRMRNLAHAATIIAATNGLQVRCTADHPVYVEGKGYQNASSLKPGDQVRVLQRSYEYRQAFLFYQVQEPISYQKKHPSMSSVWQKLLHHTIAQKTRRVLFSDMFRYCEMRRKITPVSRRQRDVSMCRVRSYHAQSAFSRQKAANMLFAMCCRIRLKNETKANQDELPHMFARNGNHPMSPGEAAILFSNLCGQGTIAVSSRPQEWAIRAWATHECIPTRMDTRVQESNSPTRRSSMRCLWYDTRRTRSSDVHPSHQLQQARSIANQPDYSLSFLSREDARISRESNGVATKIVTIASVQTAGTISQNHLEEVFNLEVEGNNNYFANGILVHNCDDPHDARKVESPVERKSVHSWWDHAFYNRVNSFMTGTRVIVGQRIHHDDLMGHVLKSGEFVELCIPEEYTPSRRCTTPIGYADKRTQPGELLRPERFGPVQKAAAIRRLGTRGYAAQHGQHPQEQDGVHFRPEWFRLRYTLVETRDALEFPNGKRVVLADCIRFTAFDPSTGKTGSDPQGLMSLAWTPGGDLVVLDAESARFAIEQFPREITRRYRQWGSEYIICESNGFQIYVARDLRDAGLTVREMTPESRSKLARAQRAIILAETGRIWLPREGDWVEPLIEQLTTFTGEDGGTDDLVDCLAYAALDTIRFDGEFEEPIGVLRRKRT